MDGASFLNPAPAAPPAPAPATDGNAPKPEDDPNNVHKQCEKAAAEALKRAMALLRKRGLLPPEMSPEEETPAEEKPAEEKPAEEKPVEEQPAPVNPLLNKKPATDAGNLSWYKP